MKDIEEDVKKEDEKTVSSDTEESQNNVKKDEEASYKKLSKGKKYMSAS